jgi:hypothetical protein
MIYIKQQNIIVINTYIFTTTIFKHKMCFEFEKKKVSVCKEAYLPYIYNINILIFLYITFETRLKKFNRILSTHEIDYKTPLSLEESNVYKKVISYFNELASNPMPIANYDHHSAIVINKILNIFKTEKGTEKKENQSEISQFLTMIECYHYLHYGLSSNMKVVSKKFMENIIFPIKMEYPDLSDFDIIIKHFRTTKCISLYTNYFEYYDLYDD